MTDETTTVADGTDAPVEPTTPAPTEEPAA